MGKSFFDKIQAKLELLRLEKRYTRSRHRRSAFVSNAVYVDGEYVYQTPNSTGSSSTTATTTASGGIDALHGERARPEAPVTQATLHEVQEEDERAADRRMDEEYQYEQQKKQQRKRFNRFSTSVTPTPREAEFEADQTQRKKLNRYSSMPGFGGGYDSNKSMPRIQERRLSMIR